MSALTPATAGCSQPPWFPRSLLADHALAQTLLKSKCCARTDDWVQRFLSIVDTHIPATSERLKVAVLDTGIDANHPDFAGDGRLRDSRSWVNSAAHVDRNGHGTHVVSTLLWLTQNVDVYVAKIAEESTIETADQVAEAIHVASEEWDVDLIAVPFGLPRGFRKIREEIDKAIYRRKIVFAAASDNGAHTGRAYPASQDGVICVHSADGFGNASPFNPTALHAAENFCFVGESLEAAWPSSTPNDLGGTRRMTGTAFATPVAVAVAALMIGFVSDNMPEHVNWDIPLRSPAGIRAIFRALSEQRNGQYDLVNPVRAFGGGTKAEQEKVLMDIRASLDFGA
ncbi:hypothetical protein C8A01DRAFT_35046 [Parachaetomium inaequale]|uniref:Peptidase S8/S53 domain-containing protein n=1 Tax=Parachaetomium inaequale TaxID=2588326 RepID=A0AAN6PHA5_9PEZI|nr:hypothetical protein C8A01DRAFT_35046 [Parachaetomium inaequale]